MDMRVRRVDWDIVERDKYDRVVSLTVWPRSTSDSRPSIFLVPIDGSSASLSAMNVALRLADQQSNAEFHLINVQAIGGDDALDNSVERQGLLETEAARDLLDGAQKSYQLHIATGSAANVIHDYARMHNVAEIVIGSHGTSYLERFLMGSVATDVVCRADVPVTLVKSRDRAGTFPAEWVDWLIPFDGSPAALRAVRYVIRHVSPLESVPKLHLLNVRPAGAADVDKPFAIDWVGHHPPPVRHWADSKGRFDKAIDLLEMAKLPFDVHEDAGIAADKILEAIKRHGCGHVAMGTRGLGTLGSLVLGSVSRSVVQRAAIPVTLIK